MTSRSCVYLLYLFFRCRLIIITTIYTCPNPNPSPSLSTCSSYNKCVHRLWSKVYKIDYLVLGTLSIFLYYSIQEYYQNWEWWTWLLFYFILLLLFYFAFIFSYLIGNKTKKTKCDTVTGHMIWSQKKSVEGSGTRWNHTVW